MRRNNTNEGTDATPSHVAILVSHGGIVDGELFGDACSSLHCRVVSYSVLYYSVLRQVFLAGEHEAGLVRADWISMAVAGGSLLRLRVCSGEL